MRKPERIPIILDALKVYWSNHPDLRLGQLLGIISSKCHTTDIFNLEDNKLVKYLEEKVPLHIEELKEIEHIFNNNESYKDRFKISEEEIQKILNHRQDI
jgi:uncharacterized protein YihD (DUF1040 family)